MSFGEKILQYKEDIIADLTELIAIQSVSGYQDQCTPALEWMMKKAESFGLKTKSYDGIAGHVELGEGSKLCGVLSHLDVVPEGNNWNSLPFELSVGDGYMYGRGIADDKGAALINLYCLRALKESGVIGKNTIRAIYGTCEETGMQDMELYFKNEPIPDMAFTPDSQYGICRCEKGILQLELYADTHNGTTLTQLHSGKAVNAVPDTAYALLDCTENEDHQLLRLADAKEGKFEFYYTIDGMMVLSRGKAAHACEPQKGHNAAVALIDLLTSNFSLPSLGSICSFIESCIGLDTTGVKMGIKMRDSVSGPLSLSVGTVHIDEGYATCTIDIRYPVTINGNNVLEQVKKAAANENLSVKVLSHTKPVNLDENSELIKLLSDSYEEIMGEKPNLYSTGGGTYARMLDGKGVAFGPVFEGEESNIHNANECLSVDKFFKHAQICLEAMYRMYTAE
ncbi:MAG: Sapep family Mn(2+)-dependent dipeptidase [Eubacteriales bacterium]|nr:Sapep family Mn(2+)-dependent dipeptidase [Eubacteriales bacterium]